MNRLSCIAALALALSAPIACAQDAYPSRPIQVIIPSAAGSILDFNIRLINEKFQASMGQQLVVDNRAGAAGIVAAEVLMKAPLDGYTLMSANIGQLSINPHTFTKLPYDPEKSFAPITQLITSQYVFLVHPSVGAETLSQFIAKAKAEPGKMSFASTQTGAPGHFAGVMLNQAAGLDMLHVPYKGAAPAMGDLLTGRVNSIFTTIGSAASESIRSGKLKALAVTSERRVEAFPSVPSFAEAGYPSVVAYIWTGLVAPAGTPRTIVDRLSKEVSRILRMPDVAQKLRGTDQDPVGSTPAQFAEFLRTDRARWGAAVKASGFKAD